MRDSVSVRSVLRAGYRFLLALTALSLAACGGGGSGGSGGMSSFTVGGSVTGLSASGLVLQDNGGDNLTVSSGASTFTFSTQVASGGAYAVTVLTQPTGETCTVSNATGTATANVTSVSVACTVNTYTIGGTVTGLNASGLVLQDNGTDNLMVSATGPFTFTTKLASGTAYKVTVLTQPTGQTCKVSQGTGTATANVTSVSVACTTNTYTVAGTISGLATAGLKLLDYPGGETLSVPAGATKYQFTQSVPYGTSVQVTATAQPAFETCNPGGTNHSGPITANITSDTFSCTALPATTVTVSTVTTTSVNSPAGVAVDSSGNVYVANSAGNDILLITPGGTVSVLAGNGTAGDVDGTTAASAEFSGPTGVAVNSSGTIYVADFFNNEIRQIVCTGGLTASKCQVSLLAGAGPTGAGYKDATGSSAEFYNPLGVTVGPSGNVYVADFNNNVIREVTPAGAVTTLAGEPPPALPGHANGSGTSATFNGPAGVAVDSSGNVYVADEFNNEIRMINSSDVVSTLAGSTTAGHADGTGSAASFYEPIDVAVDSAGNVYVADYANNEIRLVGATGTVSTIAGLPPPTAAGYTDGPASTATFNAPSGIAVNASDDVFVGDQNNNAIREITP